ncbi:MAG: YceD family protein [Hyphomicrobium sp.]
MTTAASRPFDWSHATMEISDGGFRRERAASPEECAAVAKALGLLDASNVKAAYKIVRIAGGGYGLSGRLTADVAQACIVTLEPVRDALDENFDVEFWPNLEANESGQDARILEGRDVELLERGDIPVGRIVFETLSAALDPYPRKPDAAFDWQDPEASDPQKVSPFAALARLKDDGS